MIATTLLVWALVVEGVLLAGALALFCGHSLWLWQYRRRYQPRLTRARALLVAVLEEVPLSHADRDWLHTFPVRWQINLVAELAPSLSGVQRQRLTALAEEMGLMTRARQHCQSWLWWRRLQGVRLFTLLGGGGEVVLPLFHDRQAVVRAQAAEWAADHPSPVVLNGLLALLDDTNGLCRFAAQNTLLCLGSTVVEPLACTLSAASERQVEAALAVAAGLADPRLLRPALTLCHGASPRIRALAATLLGALGGCEGVQVLIDLLADPAPEVRAAAAQALGKLGHWPAVSSLAALLRDRAWGVRREAALALRALGAPGMLFLRRCLADGDRFAADIAQQVLDLPKATDLVMA